MKKNKIKVVLVDDNESYCSAMKFFFEEIHEIEFIFYNNAQHFLDEHNDFNYGVLLIDLFMPGMDGITLLDQLKERNNKMYTIVISGHGDKLAALKVKELGADEFLLKPFDVDELLEKITCSNLLESKAII